MLASIHFQIETFPSCALSHGLFFSPINPLLSLAAAILKKVKKGGEKKKKEKDLGAHVTRETKRGSAISHPSLSTNTII
jgi:hypothetical protein